MIAVLLICLRLVVSLSRRAIYRHHDGLRSWGHFQRSIERLTMDAPAARAQSTAR